MLVNGGKGGPWAAWRSQGRLMPCTSLVDRDPNQRGHAGTGGDGVGAAEAVDDEIVIAPLPDA